MKTSSFSTLFLVGIMAGLQSLPGAADAQGDFNFPIFAASGATTTTASGGVVAPTGTTTSAATASASATPVVPSFINTPGLQVTSPYNGMTVLQDTVLSISSSLIDQRPISSINISVAKKQDGSSNTTIVNIPSGAILRSTQIWNITAASYPVGEYLINMIITPNTTAAGVNPTLNNPGPNASATTTTTAVVPGPTSTIPGPPVNPGVGPSVYYWQATVRVVARTNITTPGSGASTYGPGKGSNMGFASVFVAGAIAVMGS
ncbi:hypothetical protein EDD11_000200, partial [Mortierella claussenii]